MNAFDLPFGRVLGVAGGGLKDATWLGEADRGAAKVGEVGEVKTAAVLDGLALRPGGATVLHDLMLPSGKYKANVDHLVVSGSTVWIVDSKVWQPGFYWRFNGVTRRGWSRFAPADKKTLEMAQDMLGRYLRGRHIAATVVQPTMVVWSSRREGSPSLWASRPVRHDTVAGQRLAGRAGRLMKPGKRTVADVRIVDALKELLVSSAQPKHPVRSGSRPAGSRPATVAW